MNKFLTGTLMPNRTGADKSLLFHAKTSVPRGYFKWSEDEFNKVVQVCWFDRKPLMMLSSAHGPFHGGVSRLTSQGPKPGMSREQMGAPYLCKRYNEEKDHVDNHDFMALQEHFSWERRCRSRKWDRVALKGLQDRAQVNSYVVFSDRNKETSTYTHETFHYNLLLQWYNCCYHKTFPTFLRQLGKIQEVTPPEGRKMPIWQSTLARQRVPRPLGPPSPPAATTTIEIQHMKYRCNLVISESTGYPLQRQCFLCKYLEKGEESKYARKDEKRKGTFRMKLPKSSSGCRLCGVVLCAKGSCWKDYHRHYMGSNEMIKDELWQNKK
jgi:hypothetical protein